VRITLLTPEPATTPSTADGPALVATDVEVPVGARLGDLREHLARITGHPGWLAPGTRLAVDHIAVDDEHPCGQPPLLAGARLRIGRGARPADDVAIDAHRHLAVVEGPDCGALRAVDGTLVVGRSAPGTSGTPALPRTPALTGVHRLALRDRSMSERHIELMLRRGEVAVRDAGSTNGTRLVRHGRARRFRWSRRSRALRRRWVRVRPGDHLHLGASVLEIRRALIDAGPPQPRPAPPTGPRLGSAALTWLAPAAGTAALAAATGNRILLVSVLIAPAVALGQVVAERRREVRATSSAPSDPQRGGPPDVGTATGRSVGSAADAPCLVDEIAPADLATAALVGLRRGPARPGPGPDGAGDGPGGWPAGPAPGAAAAGRAIAVVGPREEALGIARTLTLGLIGPAGETALVVRCGDRECEAWDWARWLTHRSARLPGPDAARTVVVADGEDTHAEIARWWHAAGSTHHLVLVARSPGAVPAWCDTAVEVDPGGVTLRRGGRSRSVPFRAVGTDWALSQARRAAAARTLGHRVDRGLDALPDQVGLGDLPDVGPPDDALIRTRWDAPRPSGLRATLGADQHGAVSVDLVHDGPHALVAGTTGAGKSALLQTLVLSLALAHPPTRLAIALVDYKGGASLGACADLPHVVGQVTDLDGSLATRALAGLRAELNRRERELAAAGCTDLAALWLAHDAGATSTLPPPRLLVVVDEFRTMADEHPDFLPGLLRLAAQGRSLGMHLVLATQRPAGAIGPDLRANISLRIALRVTDVAESVDVLDSPDAASILPSNPGRAVLRRGTAGTEWLQVAQVVAPGQRNLVSAAPSWSADHTGWVPDVGSDAPSVPLTSTSTARQAASAASQDDARRYVDAVRRAARGMPDPAPPWLPDLPERVHVEDVDALPLEPGDDPERTIPLALGDLPAEQRRAALRWDPAVGHLIVLGGPGSGRTTALRTIATGALDLAFHVHLVGLDLPAGETIGRRTPERTPGGIGTGLGTVVATDDPRRLARLVTLLAEGDDNGSPRLLVIDDLEATLDALAPIAHGAGAERLLGLLRDGRSRGVTVVAGARASARTLTHAPLFRSRLVLGQADAVADVLAGVPTGLAGGRGTPGRAVLIGADGAVECQVALVDEAAPVSSRRPGQLGRHVRVRTRAAPRLEPVRLRAIPVHVPLSALATDGPRDVADRTGPPGGAGPSGAAIGLGGDDAATVRLDTSRGALVVGPPGSGRSNALEVIAAGLVRAGRRVAVVAPPGALRAVRGLRWSMDHDGVVALLDELEAGAGPVDLVVDDLDDLDQARPLDVARLARLVAPDATGDVRLIASARTARAATAYREPLARLRAARRGLILDPHEPGSADVFGRSLDWVLDPALPHAHGRGALQDDRRVVAVQVARAGSAT
jgi:S-DNA-T family DNA segregation ATPase FtsK/SpoIIIE